MLGVSPQTLVTKLTGTSKGALLAPAVTPEIAREVLRLPIPGLGVQEASRRTYPAATGGEPARVRVVEDRRRVRRHRAGVRTMLSGRPGSLSYEHGRDGTRIPTGSPTRPSPSLGALSGSPSTVTCSGGPSRLAQAQSWPPSGRLRSTSSSSTPRPPTSWPWRPSRPSTRTIRGGAGPDQNGTGRCSTCSNQAPRQR